jgi:hypothetical protein
MSMVYPYEEKKRKVGETPHTVEFPMPLVYPYKEKNLAKFHIRSGFQYQQIIRNSNKLKGMTKEDNGRRRSQWLKKKTMVDKEFNGRESTVSRSQW